MNLIIGAGITGLSIGSFLEDQNYLIIEATDSIGGYCKTIKKDGFVWDYSGHFFHFKSDEIKKYLLEKMDQSQIKDCVKFTQIFYNKKYIDFPFQKNIHQLDKEEFIDCLYDLFNPRTKVEKTFKDMVYSRLGKSISEKFLIPYNEKLYACDLDKLDKDAMGRFFPHTNKEEIIRNFRMRNNNSYNSTFTYPMGGAIEYVNSIASRINPNKIVLGEKLIGLDIKNKIAKTNKREIHYSNLISTIPFPSLLNLAQIPYESKVFSWNKVLVFNLGFDKKGLDKINNWVYFPDRNIRFYRIGYYDNIFQSDKMSLYVEIGFNKDEDINIEKELKTVINDLEIVGVKQKNQKLISYIYIIMDPAYVHINKGSIHAVENIKKELGELGIYSIGRYGSWTYCSIEDNIIESKNLAEKLNK